MGSQKLKNITYSVERKAKGPRRIELYVFITALAFIVTFVASQILLGVYYV